jgi:hypothetical protein
MSKFFSDEEREQILAESRRLIEDGIDTEPRGDERSEALAEAMAQPIEKMNDRHRREIREQDELWERERKQREREAAAPDWAVVNQLVRAAIVVERERMQEVLAHTIAQMRDEQDEAIARATEALRAELKVAIAKASVAGDCVVMHADGTPDVLASMRKNRAQYRNAMRSARAASEGPMIEGTITADAMSFGAPKRQMN